MRSQVLLFAMAIAVMSYSNLALSQERHEAARPSVSACFAHDVSQPLRDIPEAPWVGKKDPREMDQDRPIIIYDESDAMPKGPDPVAQRTHGNRSGRSPYINFAGNQNSDNAGAVAPPDTEGDIGPNHYFQMNNNIFEIFDRSGNTLLGPSNSTTIWSGFNGGWTGKPISDPVVLYDEDQNRWFVSVFTTSKDSLNNYYILIAISQTGDPTGSFYRYAWAWTTKPDYAKYGIWPDGYYMGCNTSGQDIAVFERSQMLSGNAADVVTFDNPDRPNIGAFHAVIPVDCDGPFPPSGTPCYFFTINDDAWPSNATDRLMVWELDVNWTTPGSSTWSLVQSINTAAFSAQFNNGWNNIPQQGTTQKLDAIGDVLMYKVQHRYIGGIHRVVCCHTIDENLEEHAGIRWYELRKTGDENWTKYQESTYTPDSHNRWMGSIAMNMDGDIALGFSISSSTMYPSIRYTGRNAGDPLNTMTFAEMNVFTGTTFQSGTNRWGDYSLMSVDPVDDFSFWYTNEYSGSSTSWAAWRTRICSFNLDCWASVSVSDEYISNVTVGTINNSSTWSTPSGYGDYRHVSTTMAKGSPYAISISIGNASSSDWGAIWVDWNDDGDYTDANESITPVSGSPGVGPYSATIIPPLTTINGPKTMRVRLNWNAAPPPCGNTTYGEVEDYTIVVGDPVNNVWEGDYNHYWSQAYNWSLGHVPISTENVVIPSTYDLYPYVHTTNGACNYLTVESGAQLYIRNASLTVSNDLTISGQLVMSDANASLTVNRDIFWNSGSSADIQYFCDINVYRHWEFRSGANVNLDDGSVFFLGSNVQYIRTYDPDCYFNQIYVNKSGNYVSHSNLSTSPMNVHLYLYISTGELKSVSSQNINLEGNFSNNATCNLDNGTLVMNGSGNQYIYFNLPGYLNNLTINSGGTVYLNDPTDINGSLVISSGILNPLNHTINIEGNWTNTIGGMAFIEGTGRVIFDGTTHQYIYGDETFNILESNMPLAIRVNNASNVVVCNTYDWTQGGIDVIVGTFTANDLADNGLYGGFWVNPGATINLYQDGGQFVDVNGELHFSGGGNINVYGGSGTSWWAYAAPALIEMSGGVLDFKNTGIYLSTNYTLTDNITGGTVRTVGGFSTGTRTDFNPTGGTVEFYGTSDVFVSQGSPNTFYNFKVNKNVTSDKLSVLSQNQDLSLPPDPGALPRIDPPSPATRSNTVILSGDLVVDGDLIISSGALDIDTNLNTVSVARDWYNYVGDAGFIERDGTVYFTGSGESDIKHDETFYNLTENKTGSQFAALENGSGDGYGTDITVLNQMELFDGSFEVNYPGILSAYDLDIGTGATLNANDYPGVNIYIQLGWHNDNLSSGFFSTNSTVTFNSSNTTPIQIVAENNSFNKIIIDSESPWVRPSIDVGYGLIHAANMDIVNGTLSMSGEKVIIDNTLNVYDNLMMIQVDDSLLVGSITWKPGSVDNINKGNIIVNNNWTWEDGTNADITAGNTVRFTSGTTGFIYAYDATASFYNVTVDKGASSIWIHSSSTQPVHVLNNFNVLPSSLFHVQYGELDVDGIMDIQNGASMRLYNGGSVDIAQDFTLNGYVDLDGGGDFLVHGLFSEASTGSIEISGSGLFQADQAYSEPRASFTMNGTLTMTGGTFEVTHNHLNLSNTFIDAISGGDIRVGGSFVATSEVFQPSGGTFTFITTPLTGTYIQSHLNNWFYNLTLDAGVPKAIYGSGGYLTVKNDLTINSGSLNGSDDAIYLGDDWINNVGAAGFTYGTGHVYLSGTMPTPEIQEISGGTFYNISNLNLDNVVQFNGPTTIVNNYYAGVSGTDCTTLIIGSPFQVQNQLVLNQGWFSLSGSAPTVTVSIFDQGGNLSVTNGTFSCSDLVDNGIFGTYHLYNGAINLTQDAYSFIDNSADITIENGTFSIYGGADISWWPGSGTHTFTMQAGTLDIKNIGIYLSSNSMTYNITGGTLINPGPFYNSGTVTNFTPSGGCVEFSGTNSSTVALTGTNYFHDLRINKSGATLSANSNLTIHGELDVKSGNFNTNNRVITVDP